MLSLSGTTLLRFDCYVENRFQDNMYSNTCPLNQAFVWREQEFRHILFLSRWKISLYSITKQNVLSAYVLKSVVVYLGVRHAPYILTQYDGRAQLSKQASYLNEAFSVSCKVLISVTQRTPTILWAYISLMIGKALRHGLSRPFVVCAFQGCGGNRLAPTVSRSPELQTWSRHSVIAVSNGAGLPPDRKAETPWLIVLL